MVGSTNYRKCFEDCEFEIKRALRQFEDQNRNVMAEIQNLRQEITLKQSQRNPTTPQIKSRFKEN